MRWTEQNLDMAKMTESIWLKEAKAALKMRDPVDAANEADALARWADQRCRAVLRAAQRNSESPRNG